jgi:hypothetical protein
MQVFSLKKKKKKKKKEKEEEERDVISCSASLHERDTISPKGPLSRPQNPDSVPLA